MTRPRFSGSTVEAVEPLFVRLTGSRSGGVGARGVPPVLRQTIRAQQRPHLDLKAHVNDGRSYPERSTLSHSWVTRIGSGAVGVESVDTAELDDSRRDLRLCASQVAVVTIHMAPKHGGMHRRVTG